MPLNYLCIYVCYLSEHMIEFLKIYEIFNYGKCAQNMDYYILVYDLLFSELLANRYSLYIYKLSHVRLIIK